MNFYPEFQPIDIICSWQGSSSVENTGGLTTGFPMAEEFADLPDSPIKRCGAHAQGY